ASGYTFWGWSGACSGAGPCRVTMDGPKSVVAALGVEGEPSIDLNRDGKADIVWRNQVSGVNLVWLMDRTARIGTAYLPLASDVNWRIVALADFDGDGRADILWRHRTGANAVWFMNGVTRVGTASLPTVSDVKWQSAATADFNGDGRPDILWRN